MNVVYEHRSVSHIVVVFWLQDAFLLWFCVDPLDLQSSELCSWSAQSGSTTFCSSEENSITAVRTWVMAALRLTGSDGSRLMLSRHLAFLSARSSARVSCTSALSLLGAWRKRKVLLFNRSIFTRNYDLFGPAAKFYCHTLSAELFCLKTAKLIICLNK